MHAQVFSVIAPIFICTLVGVIWSRRDLPFDTAFVSRLVMTIGTPCLIVSTLSKVDIDQQQLFGVARVTFVGLLLVAVAAWLTLKIFGLEQRAYLTPLVFANCGNMGLPLCLFAFGEQGLAIGLLIFMLTAVGHFSLGVALVSAENPLRSLLRSPVFYSALLSVALIMSGLELPLWVDNTIGLLGAMSIPLMLLSLGVSLAGINIRRSKLAWRLALVRLLIGFSVACLLVWLFDLKGVERGAVLIQFSMPAAVFNYMLALHYQREAAPVAAMVLISTALSFVSLPLLLWFAYQ